MEFHHQLRKDSIEFKTESDCEFMFLNQETKQKNHQGGASCKNPLSEKRVYVTGGSLCPVKILKLFIAKQNSNATMLFNQIDNNALLHPESTEVWFSEKSLAKRSFEKFMKSISVSAKLSQHYTGHCLRATAIQRMNDAGFEARHKMFMSGHKNEASIRSYNRGCSITQKKSLSSTLSALTDPNSARQIVKCKPSTQTLHATESSKPATQVRFLDHSTTDDMPTSSQMVQSNEQNISHTYLFRGASFSNCTINIGKPE